MSSRKKQLAHLFDATQCINCGACSAACAATNYPELINEFNAGWNTIYCNIRQVKNEKKSSRPVVGSMSAMCERPVRDHLPARSQLLR